MVSSFECSELRARELTRHRFTHRKPFSVLGRLMDAVKVAGLPAYHHAVDHFADQASRDLEDAGRLQPLERVRDGLPA